MPLENADNISQLDARYPLSNDPGSKGDDHLRLIKNVLKKVFPGKDGNGFAKPITIDEDFLNSLPETIANLKSDMDKRWPKGSAVILFNNTNPNGIYPGTWALVTGDACLSFGDGSNNVGFIYGENNPNVPLPNHSHIGTFVGNPMPPHQHPLYIYNGGGQGPALHTPVINRSADVIYTDGASAGVPTGQVYVQENGTIDARLNVRGARINVNIWKRVS